MQRQRKAHVCKQDHLIKIKAHGNISHITIYFVLYYEKSCGGCGGAGRNTCSTCDGYKRLKWFVELTVTFKNNVDDYFKKSENIPDKKLRLRKATNTFTEQNLRVSYPMTCSHD